MFKSGEVRKKCSDIMKRFHLILVFILSWRWICHEHDTQHTMPRCFCWTWVDANVRLRPASPCPRIRKLWKGVQDEGLWVRKCICYLVDLSQTKTWDYFRYFYTNVLATIPWLQMAKKWSTHTFKLGITFSWSTMTQLCTYFPSRDMCYFQCYRGVIITRLLIC